MCIPSPRYSSVVGIKRLWTRCLVNLRDKLGIAISQQAYKSYRDLLETDRWQRLAAHGARPQRLLFASTGTKDPQASDVLYIGALAAPNTVNTMPEETLLAFDAHGRVERTLPRDGGDGDATVAAYGRAGIDGTAVCPTGTHDEMVEAVYTGSVRPRDFGVLSFTHSFRHGHV